MDERADALARLARRVHDHHTRPERRTSGEIVETFDNLCAGYLERASLVLEAAGFTAFLDDLPRRSRFLVAPTDFAATARAERAGRIDPALVAEAARCLDPAALPRWPLGEFCARIRRTAP